MKEGRKQKLVSKIQKLELFGKLFLSFTLLIVIGLTTTNDHLWSLCKPVVMFYHSHLAFHVTLPISLHFKEPFKWSLTFFEHSTLLGGKAEAIVMRLKNGKNVMDCYLHITDSHLKGLSACFQE